MPIITEFTNASRRLRALPSFANPLPRLSAAFEESEDRYEVVVVGAGPAGLMLSLLLSRYGLGDESLLCIDSKSSAVISGQADGLQPRTLEVLKSLGIFDELNNDGCHMHQVAFWNPESDGKIERTSTIPDISVRARYPYEVTIHQGKIERVLETDLLRYSKRGVLRSTRLVNVRMEEDDPEFPVMAVVENEQGRRTIRTKYLVGADGAHSTVRRHMNLLLEGESSDHIWGVVDFIAVTDFPDIRKRCAIHSNSGSAMVIPRERTQSGEYLTRLYVQIPGTDIPARNSTATTTMKYSKAEAKAIREQISLDSILNQAKRIFRPYSIKMRDDKALDWWAAYQIGQRMSRQFSVKDSMGKERVFIVGDACHTHSPKAGQGMNVSMMDSYNLAWKLIHCIHHLTPSSKNDPTGPDFILETYSLERSAVAEQLIDFDKQFAEMFSGKINIEQKCGLTHDQFLDIFRTGNGLSSGCGIEYISNILIEKDTGNAVVGQDYLQGTLQAGRRLADVQVCRHADANPRHLQDDFPSNGRYCILYFASTDLLDPNGISSEALAAIDEIISTFPEQLIELTGIYPGIIHDFDWQNIPKIIKQRAEMRFHAASIDDVYNIYGVSADRGAIAVIRPDGYVGMVVSLSEPQRIESYLSRCLHKF